MGKKIQIRNSTAEFLIFTNQAREDGIEVRLQDDTIFEEFQREYLGQKNKEEPTVEAEQ